MDFDKETQKEVSNKMKELFSDPYRTFPVYPVGTAVRDPNAVGENDYLKTVGYQAEEKGKFVEVRIRFEKIKVLELDK